ncbi:MAG: chemotaxis protein CheB [Verrucomicrobia bacterium]|nr:chemotaxis protein CheB [Cytophagales bacterium]
MNQFKLSNQYKAVVIGGSAGSFQVINKILAALPKDFELPVILCLHRLKHVRHGFVEALNIKSTKEITEPEDKETIKKGQIYLAPANYHLLLELGNHFALSTDEMVNNSRPAIDLTMETAAYVYKNKLVGVLLSGANKDGAWGMKRIKDRGGLTVIQDPKECMIDTMPVAAQKLTQIDYTLSVEHLCEFFKELDKQYR